MKGLKMKKDSMGMGSGAHAIDSTVHSVVGGVVHQKGKGQSPEGIIGKIIKKK